MTIIHCLGCFFIGMIVTLIGMLVFRCTHSYETRIHKVDHYYSDGTRHYTSWIYTNTCKYCGKVKVKKVSS